MRENSRSSESRVSDKVSDQRFGNGTRAVTFERTPDVRTRGSEGGMRVLISYNRNRQLGKNKKEE